MIRRERGIKRKIDWRALRERESDGEESRRLESSERERVTMSRAKDWRALRERESDDERFRVFFFFFFFFTGWVWILSIPDPKNSDNIHTLPGSSWVEFNRVLPETFESDRVRYPLPNEYGHP